MACSLDGFQETIVVEPLRIAGRQAHRGAEEKVVTRILGGYAVYLAGRTPFAINVDGWKMVAGMTLVPPFTQHQLLRNLELRTIVIEPESVCPHHMLHGKWMDDAKWLARINEGFREWTAAGSFPGPSIDELLFGHTLPERAIDARIGVVANILSSSTEDVDITSLAARVNLSNSRLSHLFKEQIGVSMRSFRAWKRVRQTIHFVLTEPNLLAAAMRGGFADESHFSHSMARCLGRSPSMMRDHWRHNMQRPAPDPGLSLGRSENY